ncbi:MAG: hypothetical protein MUE73_01940 [Planctomycetes bacterium]|jgi:tetratricopeptide (TPR) repeat protein|nr:hypothetical protein [Planctomycetota bacterium]
MRAFRNSLAALGAIFLIATGGYYLHRRAAESEKGTAYSLVDAPRDLVREFVGLFAGAPKPPPSDPPPAVAGSIIEPPPTSVPAADQYARGRRAYLEADFAGAVPLLEKALARPAAGVDSAGGSSLLARARLFRFLLEDLRLGAALDGPPMARIQLAGGDPFLADLVEETPVEVTFRKEGGISARVKRGELGDSMIARTPEQKQALAETEYQRRHAGLRGAAAWLDLARFCRAHGLSSHVTYLLEKALEEPGDGVERALYEVYRKACVAGDRPKSSASYELLGHFFRSGELTRAAMKAERGGTAPPAGGTGDGDETASGPEPASGIGSVGARIPKSANPELNAVLERAAKLKSEGDAHYLKAQPGAPDRAAHREKALKAYTEAIELFEKAEEQWGVSLERIFKELYERRYQMLKDTPAR